MAMYDQAAQRQLEDRIAYERWALGFLQSRLDQYVRGSQTRRLVIRADRSTVHHHLGLEEHAGAGLALEVIDAMLPLIFTASFKIIDMLFEWILEENDADHLAQEKRAPSRWPFADKIKYLGTLPLTYPSVVQAHPFIAHYPLALYSNLTKFRNEIVHRKNFSATAGVLSVTTGEQAAASTLTLTRDQLEALSRVATSVADLLTGAVAYGKQAEAVVEYSLDQISQCHGLAAFGRGDVRKLAVVYVVGQEQGEFRVDLQRVRDKVASQTAGYTALFDVRIVGTDQGIPTIAWFLPMDDVPPDDVLILRPDERGAFRVALRPEDWQAAGG